MASRLKTKWARDTAREVEAKKMAAKVAIITSKQARYKAETTSRQAAAMSKKLSVLGGKKGLKGPGGGGHHWVSYCRSNEGSKAIKVNGENEPER